MKNICDYGCGKEANYVLKNKKNCCSISWHKCEFIREKNSKRVKLAYIEGRRKSIFTEKHRIKGHQKRRENLANQTDEYFIKGIQRCRASLKRKMVEDLGMPYECKECGISKEWNNKPLTLELHHKDGDKFNSELDNLQILCPNCHSQTPNHRFKNRKKKCPSGGTG